jgi:hypothetical protein
VQAAPSASGVSGFPALHRQGRARRAGCGKAIRRGSFGSVKELVAKIDHFVAHYNQNCKPFTWTATADSILAKLSRLCERISGTEH